MTITSALRNNKTYFTALLLLVLASCTLLLLKGKADSFILLNSFHAPFLDAFFMGYTNVGDGLFALALVVLVFFFFKQKPLAIALLLSYCVSGILAQVLKQFTNAPRPAAYFQPGQYTHFINGLHLATQFSFPSGHTTTAFALATVLAIFNKNKNRSLLLLVAAGLVGFSRIYLAQHFLLDVISGAILGTLTALAVFHFTTNNPMPEWATGKKKATPQSVA